MAIGGVPLGCGPVSVSDAIDDADEVYVFEDDEDPATAALPVVEGELLVQPFPGAGDESLVQVYSAAGAARIGQLAEIGVDVLEVDPDQLAEAAGQLSESGLIEGIHKNYLLRAEEIPDDPLYQQQPHLRQIKAEDAWDMSIGDEDVIIAIVDTGVDPDHPDLADKIIDGWNVFDGDSDFGAGLDHGTLVAGVAGALSDNDTGVAGVAWDCPIIAVRATGATGGTSARDLAAGILWATGHGARVINVSFAPLWSNSIVSSAAEYAYARGALVVISSGNSGGTHSASGYPEALFVGAVDDDGRIADFSDRGPFVDVVAPGVSIRSTAPEATYRVASGTSFAAPIVTGLAALVWSVNPDLRPVSVVEIITGSATDIGSRGEDSTYGFGLVNAEQALEDAADWSVESDHTPPTVRITRPSDNAVLTGNTAVSVAATDRWGVADVVLSVDGVPFATDGRSPYRFVIDTTQYSPGRHELSVVATDHAGNPATEKTVSVVFGATDDGDAAESEGGIVFVSPSEGSTVSGTVTIKAVVSAEAGLATAEWLVDGSSRLVSKMSGKSSEVVYAWRTAGVDAGTHTISLVVIDSAGGRFSESLTLKTR